MSEKKDSADKAGLGKLVYSEDSKESRQARSEVSNAKSEVQEDSEESFPASDPPSFTKTEIAPKAGKPDTSGPDEGD